MPSFIKLLSSAAFISFIALPGTVHATLPYDCNFDGVKSIELPVYPNDAKSVKFNYQYQVAGTLDPNQIVLIYLPGGPGGSSMHNLADPTSSQEIEVEGLPKNVPIIYFDPRTSGCNHGDSRTFPDDSLRSDYLAADILSVIKALGLKKYILYGISYGSQLATFVAAAAPNVGVVAPYAAVLGGVLGVGASDGHLATPLQYAKEWDLDLQKLSPNVKKILSEPAPLGVPRSAWDNFLERGIKRGNYVFKGRFTNPMMDILKKIDSLNDQSLAEIVEAVQEPQNFGWRPGDFSDRLFSKVDCHEFSPADESPAFSNLSIVPDPESSDCKNELYDRPYDSANLQMNTPLYYLAGTNDPAAPFEGARYHFEHQKTSRRNFAEIPGGGHNTPGRIFPDCRDQFWKAVFELKDLSEVLHSCIAPAILTIKNIDEN